MAAIKAARRETKDKRADARLKALELRAEGMELSEVSQATGFHAAYVSQLVAKYRDHGLEAISGNHYGGNHRNMSFEEEAAILAPFKARAEKGELVEISEIETAYQQAVGHSMFPDSIQRGIRRNTHQVRRTGNTVQLVASVHENAGIGKQKISVIPSIGNGIAHCVGVKIQQAQSISGKNCLITLRL